LYALLAVATIGTVPTQCQDVLASIGGLDTQGPGQEGDGVQMKRIVIEAGATEDSVKVTIMEPNTYTGFGFVPLHQFGMVKQLLLSWCGDRILQELCWQYFGIHAFNLRDKE
jgi:hypothetical protein